MSLESKLARILGGISTSNSSNWSLLGTFDILRFIGIASVTVGFLGAGGHSVMAGILCFMDVGDLKPSFSSTALNSPNDGLPGSWEETVLSTWLSPPFSCIGSGSWILPCASCSCSWRWWSVLGWSWNCDIFLINNSATSIFSFSFWSAYAGRREKERKQWGSLEERKKVRYKTPDEFSSHIYNHENENTVIFSVVWAIFSRLLWLVFLCTFSRERKRQTDRERAGGEGGTFQTHPRRRIQIHTHTLIGDLSPLNHSLYTPSWKGFPPFPTLSLSPCPFLSRI